MRYRTWNDSQPPSSHGRMTFSGIMRCPVAGFQWSIGRGDGFEGFKTRSSWSENFSTVLLGILTRGSKLREGYLAQTFSNEGLLDPELSTASPTEHCNPSIKGKPKGRNFIEWNDIPCMQCPILVHSYGAQPMPNLYVSSRRSIRHLFKLMAALFIPCEF